MLASAYFDTKRHNQHPLNESGRESDDFELCLCSRCADDFRNSGHRLLKKGWQDVKDTCDFCNTGKGFVYDISGGSR